MITDTHQVDEATVDREREEEEYGEDEFDNLSIASTESHGENFAQEIEGQHDVDGSARPQWSARTPDLLSVGAYSSREPATAADLVSQARVIYGDPHLLLTAHDDFDGPRFRLLQLAPGEEHDEICGNLLIRPVFDAPRYTALSYSWGTEPRCRQILLGKRQPEPFPVSAHLYAALQRLRHATEPTMVWVDAICINQTNFVERGAQVHIMAQIFNAAEEVTIWLGTITETDVPDRELFWQLCQQPNPWWRRLWILQECAYARACPVVSLGRGRVPLQQFIARWEAVVAEALSKSERQRQWILKHNLEYLRTPYQAWKAQTETGRHRMPLLQRLRETAGRGCTVRLDRIYSILSLVDEAEADEVIPDYRRPYSEVLLEVEGIVRRSTAQLPQDEFTFLHNELSSSGLTQEGFGETPDQALLTAVVAGDTNGLIKLLLDHRMVVDAVSDGHTVLTWASQHNQAQMVEELLAYGADVNKRNELGESLLTVPNGDGQTALTIASLCDSPEVIKALLQGGTNTEIQHASGGFALTIASARGQVETVKMLLDHGANVDAQNSHRDLLLITEPSIRASPWVDASDAMEQLQEGLKGAEIHKGTKRYDCALQAAVMEGKVEVVKLLLQHGADVNAAWERCRSALVAASAIGNVEVLQLLLAHGADVNASCEVYGSALIVAAVGRNPGVVRMLLAHGADPAVRGGMFGKFLIAAAVSGHEEVIQRLMADMKLEEVGSWTARDAARWSGRKWIEQMLLEYEARMAI